MKNIPSIIVEFLFSSCLNNKNTPLENNPFVIDTNNIVPHTIASINCSLDTGLFSTNYFTPPLFLPIVP
jgi:hypothetical protein